VSVGKEFIPDRYRNPDRIVVWEEVPSVRRFLTDFLRSCTSAAVDSFADFSELSLLLQKDIPTLTVVSSPLPSRALSMFQQVRDTGAQTRIIVCTDTADIESWETFTKLGITEVVNRTTEDVGHIITVVRSALRK